MIYTLFILILELYAKALMQILILSYNFKNCKNDFIKIYIFPKFIFKIITSVLKLIFLNY